MSNKTPLFDKKYLPAFVLITGCFAWWGLANNMTDTLLAAFKRIKSMSDLQTSFIQFAFYGAYFCFALPAALYVRKYAYRSGILLGLGLFILGGFLFYPASITQEYIHFLAALYILAGGLSILETAANPYILTFGAEENATQRLNFAQSFNPLGSIIGVVISKFFILSELNEMSEEERLQLAPEQLSAIQTSELNAVMGPYVVISFLLLLIWIAICFVKMPSGSDTSQAAPLVQTLKRLFGNKKYMLGVTAQFFYVGAQICVWSFTIRYVMRQLDISEEAASTYYIAALILFALSRFVCAYLMTFVKPSRLLGLLAALAVALSFTTAVAGGYTGVLSLVGISACMSLMFPTIYGIALEGVSGEDTKIGASGLIMAILGGAVLTGIQGVVSDNFSIETSYLVPMTCFVVILLFSHYSHRRQTQS